jgi:hypothetical protein
VDGDFKLGIGLYTQNWFDYRQNPNAIGFGNSSPHPPTDIAVNATIIEFATNFDASSVPVSRHRVDLSPTGVITLMEKYPAGLSKGSWPQRLYTLVSSAFAGLTLNVVKNTCNSTEITVPPPKCKPAGQHTQHQPAGNAV